MNISNILASSPVVAILRHIPLADTVTYAQAALNAGVRAFEVALNSENALDQISILRTSLPDEIFVGAGTCITVEKCRQAHDSGAQFFLSPAANDKVLEYCAESELALLPGVMTPSDVEKCVNHGFNHLKLFPASDLPKNYIRSLKGPFDGTEYVAVGGVSPSNMKDFFDRGFIGVGIGSNLFSKELVQQRKWDKACSELRGYTKILEGIK